MPFFCETLKCCWEERHFLHPACLQALGWSSLAAASLLCWGWVISRAVLCLYLPYLKKILVLLHLLVQALRLSLAGPGAKLPSPELKACTKDGCKLVGGS